MNTKISRSLHHRVQRLLLIIFTSAGVCFGAPGGPGPFHTEQFGYAVWYRVPIHSLAHRRAKENEFTAAHNRLPLGTLVRVTRISNDKSVVVRITDRGITNRRATIDICKEAAEELGMIRAGFVQVCLEIVPEPDEAPGDDEDELAAAQ